MWPVRTGPGVTQHAGWIDDLSLCITLSRSWIAAGLSFVFIVPAGRPVVI